jgi:hypothetical protein
VAESRRPVLVFELGGRDWVVLSEPDYHELVERRREPGPDGDLRASQARLDRPRKMPQPVRHWVNESVLRGSSAQRAGARGQERLPGDPPGASRSVSGPSAMPRLRPRERGEVGRLGRVQRKGAPPDQASATSDVS